MKKTKSAFTILELIFAIVLLGIIGTMSADIISRTYDNYNHQNDVANLQSKSKQTLDQIINYLNESIDGSIAKFDGANYIDIDTITTFDDINNSNYFVWIQKDTESLRGIWDEGKQRIFPGYSGLANIIDSNNTFVVTSPNDCDLSFINQIQQDITSITDPLNGTNPTPRAALYFVYGNAAGTTESRFWKAPTSSLFPITSISSNIITLQNKPDEISEHFYLTYSAYGLHLQNNGELRLVWNFRPWNNESVANGESLLLMQDVVSFNFWSESEGTIIRFKVCLSTSFNDTSAPIFCKEAMVTK